MNHRFQLLLELTIEPIQNLRDILSDSKTKYMPVLNSIPVLKSCLPSIESLAETMPVLDSFYACHGLRDVKIVHNIWRQVQSRL